MSHSIKRKQCICKRKRVWNSKVTQFNQDAQEDLTSENIYSNQGGIVLGPSVLGNYTWFKNSWFPLKSVVVLEKMKNLGLQYFLFLVEVELELAVIKRIGKKAVVIAHCGMVVPFLIGTVASSLMVDAQNKNYTSYLLSSWVLQSQSQHSQYLIA
ncbi:hypothetical protein IFM89_004065 [Coptis chinensis]|uniref:Cation/H+ exchanger transmembrane domain-containing protein n=1 Tax=Coptis chinensis TaxID=261450 RepID=A0A835H153_9MAGN|nr:hypothetical protein IFM89_004065 [Coptis chinensis]